MGLKKITWPSSEKVLKHFIIALVGMIFLIIFFALVDTALSDILTNFYK